MNIIVREEYITDYKETEEVVRLAFASAEHSDGNEHQLVRRIRNSNSFIPELSLVAVRKDKIVGHILLSKIKIINDKEMVAESLALAPLSVLPEYQNKGIGRQLIIKALDKAKKLGFESVVVLGHPEYYPKFGFKNASIWGIKAPFEVPDEVFMAIELHDKALENISGVIEYPKEFFV